jgi:hypothetical protein
MKSNIRFVTAALLLAGPALAFAQSTSQGLSREQVRNEMAQYEAAGFNPARQNPRTWVDDAQSASAKVVVSQRTGSQTQVAQDRSAHQ